MVAVSFLDCFQHWLWWFLPEAVYAEFVSEPVISKIWHSIVKQTFLLIAAWY